MAPVPVARRIYLDHAATTPLDPRVLEAMLPYLTEHFGNASSVHALGRRARGAVEEARERIAALLCAEPSEIIFTSGATEANNTAVAGLRTARRSGLATSRAEHEAVLRPAEALAEEGAPVRLITPRGDGSVSPEQVAAALDESEAIGLVSIMYVNNEIGTISDVAAIGAVCRARGVLFHTDAVQAAGYLPLDVASLGADALSLSSHKIYGPKGVGILYVRGGVELRSFVRGGAQERGRRGGTENVAALVGMAEAFALARQEAADHAERLAALRDRLAAAVTSAFGHRAVVNTPPGAAAAPHIVNVAFPPVDGRPLDGEMLLLGMDLEGIHLSSGSACTSGAVEPSHVLEAIGLPRETAAAAVRFSLGRGTTEEEVDLAVEALERVAGRLRGEGVVRRTG